MWAWKTLRSVLLLEILLKEDEKKDLLGAQLGYTHDPCFAADG
jgi:hypothetical protein